MPNDVEFHAMCVVTRHPDDECHLVGFADRERGPTVHLLLQRAFEFDEQDLATGMDTYHVEWCDQGQSGYGGIARFVLRPAQAEVTFDESAIEDMGDVRSLVMSFELAASRLQELQVALRQIFHGTDCLVVEA